MAILIPEDPTPEVLKIFTDIMSKDMTAEDAFNHFLLNMPPPANGFIGRWKKNDDELIVSDDGSTWVQY